MTTIKDFEDMPMRRGKYISHVSCCGWVQRTLPYKWECECGMFWTTGALKEIEEVVGLDLFFAVFIEQEKWCLVKEEGYVRLVRVSEAGSKKRVAV